jgi:hypothetical protein
MKFSRNKLFALFAMISMVIGSSGMMAIDNVKAVTQQRDSTTFIAVSPNVIGVGQTLTVMVQVMPSPSGPTFYNRAPDPITGIYDRYENVTVTFTRPDGSKDTFLPIDTTIGVPGAMGPCGIYFLFNPTQTGTWSVTASFPGQTFSAHPLNDTSYYKPSTSTPATFTVVEEKQIESGILTGWPYSPLPTGYWTRPINTDNREWFAIGGNWMQGTYDDINTLYNPYSTAPQSAHIVWEIPRISQAGIAGGDWGSLSYPAGGGQPGIILNGMYILNNYQSGTFSAFDLRTGEKLYTVPGTINKALNMRIDQSNVGASGESGDILTPMLWEFASGTWKMYNPTSGALVQTITNVPTKVGTETVTLAIRTGEGSSAFYVSQSWGFNTTIPWRQAGTYLMRWDYKKVTGNNWQTGVVWNVSLRLPDGRGVSDNMRGVDLAVFYKQNVVITWAIMEDFLAAYDMTTGARLYVKDVGFQMVNSIYRGPTSDDLGIFGILNQIDNKDYAFDVKTGSLRWKSDTAYDFPWGGQRPYSVRAGNTMYSYSTDGYVRAVDLTTGKQLWQTHIGYTNETIYGTWPSFNVLSGGPGAQSSVAGADKTFFMSTGISWGQQPYSRFHRMRAYDMDTGDLRWSIAGIYSVSAIADGYVVASNAADGNMYNFGKGKTETAVSIQDDVIAKGSSALIKGTVMDISPAQPNTPAVADESMTEWMEYLHMQNATLINTPPTPKGVSVLLYAIDPNGNYQEIGMVTSDSNGLFSTLWTPPIEGKYTVYATFMGSESYWTSSGTTALGVSAVAPTSTPTQTAANVDNSMLLYGILVAVIIAIIIGLMAVFLVLRKH